VPAPGAVLTCDVAFLSGERQIARGFDWALSVGTWSGHLTMALPWHTVWSLNPPSPSFFLLIGNVDDPES
jgi:hypothetical protein